MKHKRPLEGREHSHEALQMCGCRPSAIRDEARGQRCGSPCNKIKVRSVFRRLADFAYDGRNALLAKQISECPSVVRRKRCAGLQSSSG